MGLSRQVIGWATCVRRSSPGRQVARAAAPACGPALLGFSKHIQGEDMVNSRRRAANFGIIRTRTALLRAREEVSEGMRTLSSWPGFVLRGASAAAALLAFCFGMAAASAPADASKVGVAAAVNPDAFSSLSGAPTGQLNIGKSIFFNERIKTTDSGLVQGLRQGRQRHRHCEYRRKRRNHAAAR